MMDWVVGSTNRASAKCCYWRCLCCDDWPALSATRKAWNSQHDIVWARMMLAVGWLLQPVVLHVGRSGGLCGCPRSGLYHHGRSNAILTGSQPRPSILLRQCYTPSVFLLRTSLHRSDHPRTNDTIPAVQRRESWEYDRLPYAPHGRTS